MEERISGRTAVRIIIEAIDRSLLDLGEDASDAIYDPAERTYNVRRGWIPEKLEELPEGSLGLAGEHIAGLVAKNFYSRSALDFEECDNWMLVDHAKNAATEGAVRIAAVARRADLPCYIASILRSKQRYASHYMPVFLLCVLVAISYGSVFIGTVQASTTTYFPSSSNVLTGSYVSGDMTSLVNIDSNYYIVRSASSATATVPYNPTAYNLLGGTSSVSGALADLASNNGVYMTFRSYASQTSTTSPSRAIIGYRSSTGTFTLSSPKTRSWDGSAWDGTESELSSSGSPVRWVRAAYSPLMARYHEKIIVTLSDDGYLDAYVWTGSSWSVTNNIGFVGTTANVYRPFDVAYEKTSGKALLVYGVSSTDPNNDLAYRVWNGFSWSAETYINDSGHGTDVQYYWVDLRPAARVISASSVWSWWKRATTGHLPTMLTTQLRCV